MKSRLTNINLIKKIMIGLMLICFCIVGINVSSINNVYAKDPQYKTKTFWINSQQQVDISFVQNEDKTNITKDGWHQGGTIKCSEEPSTKSGYKYQYRIEMKQVDVTHYTPYIKVKAHETANYRPTGTLDISSTGDYQYGQSGMNRGGNQVHNLDTYLHNDEMQVYIGLGFTQSRFAVNFASKADYGLKWHISFDSNGGSVCNPISGNYNTSATLPTPTRKGYSFNGWSGELGSNLKGKTNNITWGTWTDYYTTLTAQWTPNPYTVSFQAEKPSTANSTISVSGSMNKQEFKYDIGQYLNPNAFSLTGYDFSKWHRKDNSSIKYENGAYIYNENDGKDFTLVTEWVPKVLTITANDQGGTGGFGSIYEKYDTGYYTTNTCTSKVTKVSIPVKIGYEFKGYYTGTNASGTQLIKADGTVIDNSTTNHLFSTDSTIYASWEPCKYTISLNANGGSGGTGSFVEKFSVGNYTNTNCTTTISKITIPTKANYTFGGYYTEQNVALENASQAKGKMIVSKDGNIVSGNTDFTANTTVYAVWVAKDYKITLNANTIDGVDVPVKGTLEYFEKYSLYNYVNKPIPNLSSSSTITNNYNYNGQWQTFTAPYTGTYTFTCNGKSTTYNLAENETIKIYAR